MLDLAMTSVFLDFDGTVTVADAGRHVLERLGDPAWRAVDQEYRAGLLGSREVLSREWPFVSGGLAAARVVAREVAIDAGFLALVEELRVGGAEVTVVSDGFGFYATEVCEAAAVEVLTNRVGPDDTLEFPWTDMCCPCSTCGVCKQSPIKEARRRDRTTVLVGDGVSDRKAALLADVLFAKGDLAGWCDEAGIEYRPFADLVDVRVALIGR